MLVGPECGQEGPEFVESRLGKDRAGQADLLPVDLPAVEVAFLTGEKCVVVSDDTDVDGAVRLEAGTWRTAVGDFSTLVQPQMGASAPLPTPG